MKVNKSLFPGLVATLFLTTITYGKTQTEWMPADEFKQFMADLKVNKKGEKFWKHRWITEVDGRYKDGHTEFRIEYEPAPECGKYLWHWWWNMTEKTFEQRKKQCEKKGMELVHKQTYTLPCGEKRYQCVWQYQD
jgi:hypothetical protein